MKDGCIDLDEILSEMADLEKENAELQDKLKNLSSVAELRLTNWQKYEKENVELKKESNQLFLEGAKRVEALEKENAELKEQLTEAEKIIKKLSIYVRDKCYLPQTLGESLDRQGLLTMAEQFISEVEK